MEITGDLFQAQVIIIYLHRVQTALFIDKRTLGEDGPVVRLIPESELLLQGREVSFPLSTRVVADIERRQFRHADLLLLQSYFDQLKEYLQQKLTSERPELGVPETLCLAPHYAPVMVLAHSKLFARLLQQFIDTGHPEMKSRAIDMLKEVYASEVSRPEAIRQENVERLKRDFRVGEEWAVFAQPEES